MKAETLKRLHKLEAERATKNTRSVFFVCEEHEDEQQKIAELHDSQYPNTTYVILRI